MGWREFTGWLETMSRQRDGGGVTPDSWQGADSDPWWQQVRQQREEARAR